MDEQQIKDWLGLANEPRPLKPEIVEGMADAPWPETDAEHMEVFAAFLACANSPYQILGIALGDATEVVEETPDADQADPAARDRDAAAPGAPEPPDAL